MMDYISITPIENVITFLPVVSEALTIDGDIGLPGPPGPAGEAYIYQQMSASDAWAINHNLGFRPNIHVSDTAGNEVVGEIFHVSNYSAFIYFSAPFAGYARCS